MMLRASSMLVPLVPSFGSKKDLLNKKLIPRESYDKIQSRVTANGPKKQSLPEGPQH
jgi:hypothetical protein